MTSFLRGFSDAAREGALVPAPGDVVVRPELLRKVLPEGVRVLYITPGFVESRHLIGLYIDRRGSITAVAKTPRRSADSATVRAEATALVRLVELAPGLAGTVPAVLACSDWYGRPVLLESMLHGQPLTHARVRSDPRAARAVLDWLAALPVTGSSDGADLITELLAPELRALRSMTEPGDPLLALADRTEQALEPLRGVELPRVFEHGDPSHPNLLVPGRRRRTDGPSVGIVDWELARADGAPGHDLAQYLAFLCFARAGVHGTTDESAVLLATFGDSGGAGMTEFSARLRARGVPGSLARPLLVLAWARSALRLLPRLAAQDSVAGAGTTGPYLVQLLRESRNASLWRTVVDAM